MIRDQLAVWREDIIGEWQPERCGVDLLYLEPAAGHYDSRLSIRADGTWGWPNTGDTGDIGLPAGMRWLWDLSADHVLSLWTPIAPMPEYDMPDWSREEKQWLVLSVTGLSLALADSHQVVLFRRVERESYDHRKAAEYARFLCEMRSLYGPSKTPNQPQGPAS